MAKDITEAILKQIRDLPRSEQEEIVAEIQKQLAQTGRPHKRSILELRGLGKEIWEGVNVDEYLREERESWDG